MLFGTLELQEEVIKQAQKYAEEDGVKLVFGAMIGSISKGLQYADSDYDERFLYLRKDFPQKICIPTEMKEEELVKRHYPENKIYDCIPFWEMTSFLQFLVEPGFKDDFSVGLYNIVGWTFLSPYIWDPYGLQSKLVPLMNKIFCSEYEIAYHKEVLEKYIVEFGRERIITKNYLYAVHAAATIEWSVKYKEQPPVHLHTLLHGLKRYSVWNEVRRILGDARRISRENYTHGSTKPHDSHYSITSVYNKVIEEYVYEIKRIINTYKLEENISKECQGTISDMYDIIYESVFNNEEILL